MVAMVTHSFAGLPLTTVERGSSNVTIIGSSTGGLENDRYALMLTISDLIISLYYLSLNISYTTTFVTLLLR